MHTLNQYPGPVLLELSLMLPMPTFIKPNKYMWRRSSL